MDVIARRSFQLLDQQNTEILLSIERPFADGPDFKCRYEIDWPGDTQRGYAMGVDEVQALQLALRKAGADINYSTYAIDKKLVWLEPGKTADSLPATNRSSSEAGWFESLRWRRATRSTRSYPLLDGIAPSFKKKPQTEVA
jgi:uncharacterized protein DUF6968